MKSFEITINVTSDDDIMIDDVKHDIKIALEESYSVIPYIDIKNIEVEETETDYD